MKKFGIQMTVLLLVIFGALYLAYNQGIVSNVLPVDTVGSQRQIRVDDVTLDVEVADTPAKRSRGLSGRESLASNSGMLFTFLEAGKHQFWMKGMKFPLDFVFIREGKVVDVIYNAPPSEVGQKDSELTIYEPTAPIDMLLEVNGGFALSRNIKVGSQVYLIK